jgi:hypothetical protein
VALTRRTLVLRYADVGIATYGSLRVVGEPERTVTWVVEEPLLLAALAELDAAIPEPGPGESLPEALTRALADGPFTSPRTELELAYRLGVLLLSDAAWRLLVDCVASPRAVVFVAPSARLARVPWGLLALPAIRPVPAELVEARAAAITAEGSVAAVVPWPADDIAARTAGERLMELVDVLMTLPANVVHAPRAGVPWAQRQNGPALLVLDPRVPNQRADSALGSVLGRPGADTPLARHFQTLLDRAPVRPPVSSAVEFFRRSDTDRAWLAGELASAPNRMLFVGHATAADVGRADQAAVHLADEVALTAVDVMALRLEMPPRVALLACASGGDYRFDEATGLVAAVVLGGAELVTATLWTLPTTAGFRRFAGDSEADPMAEVVMAVDDAHQADDAGCAVNAWQRAQMRRWRDGDTTASPIYWAALVTFTVDGAR